MTVPPAMKRSSGYRVRIRQFQKVYLQRLCFQLGSRITEIRPVVQDLQPQQTPTKIKSSLNINHNKTYTMNSSD